MKSSIPFTPPHVSLNRVQIADLPGTSLDNHVRGRKAYDLLSSQALARYARERAGELNLPAAFLHDSVQTRVGLPRYLIDCLSSPHGPARAAAKAVSQRLGRNLGHILLVLHRGDPINRDARPDWTAADWERWGGIRRIWLGGGLMSGPLGDLILHHARDFLTENGYGEALLVGLSPYRGDFALLGAARYLPSRSTHSICLDLGQTLVKRACFSITGGTLTGWRRYPSLAVDWDQPGMTDHPEPDRGKLVLDSVAGVIVQTLDDSSTTGLVPGEDIMLSVAAYVQGGRLLGGGLYAQMSATVRDVRPLLTDAIRRRSGETVRIQLIHDGSAAAALHAGERDTAVILVGTALGTGFPPGDASDLRPVGLILSDRRR
jgi:hypothetical protein